MHRFLFFPEHLMFIYSLHRPELFIFLLFYSQYCTMSENAGLANFWSFRMLFNLEINSSLSLLHIFQSMQEDGAPSHWDMFLLPVAVTMWSLSTGLNFRLFSSPTVFEELKLFYAPGITIFIIWGNLHVVILNYFYLAQCQIHLS